MPIQYHVKIDEPWTHLVKVSLNATRKEGESSLLFSLPVWSPGSYLVREYSMHVRRIVVTQANGEFLYFEKVKKNQWLIDWDKSELKTPQKEFSVSYEVYCNEIGVRNSHVNLEHAFLHGPTYLVGLEGREKEKCHIKVEFPSCWSKLNTSLKDISEKREVFLYEADDYDELLDCPIEIGCQETDGFRFEGKDHYLSYTNLPSKVGGDLKKDIKTIVAGVADFWGEVPYEQYVFISHFFPGVYGGLEHMNSTALQFDPLDLGEKEGYFDYLGLVAHEYFHTWNVKRVRPKELGPFNYNEENYTRMHWLTEGFTSFVDDLFVFSLGLSSEDFFLKRMAKKFNAYYKTPGRFFDSIEDSSFDAWIKLYRPHGNSKNASVNYYLNGALAFFCLNGLLVEAGSSSKEFARELWKLYKKNPSVGLEKEDVLEIIEKLASKEASDKFNTYISQTIDLPLEQACALNGLEIEWKTGEEVDFGCDFKMTGGNVFVENVLIDGAAYKCGLNNGDEIVARAKRRLNAENFGKWRKTLVADQIVDLLICRHGSMLRIDVTPSRSARSVSNIKVKDRDKFEKALKLS